MIGACFNFSTVLSNVIPAPASATFRGRNVTFLPPGSPRISRSTSFWSAFQRGGLDGLRRSLVRTLNEYQLSDSAKSEKISKASSCLLATLKSPINSPKWRDDLAKVLQEANWLEVDIKKTVQLALAQMTDDEQGVLIHACSKQSASAWLNTEISEFKDKVKELKIGFSESGMLALRGAPLGDPKQQAHWKIIDQFVMVEGDLTFSDMAAKIVSNNIIELLPFIRNDGQNGQVEPKSLKAFREQSVKKLKNLKTIDLSNLKEDYLRDFGVFAIENGLQKHLIAYNKESKNREFSLKSDTLEIHFQSRISSLIGSAVTNEDGGRSNVFDEKFKEFDKNKRFAVALKATKKLSPAALVVLSKSSSNRADDECLIGTAIKLIDQLDAKAMHHERLIAYLKIPQNDLPPASRASLLEEAKKRITLANCKGFESLEKGLNSGSCGDLVRAVWEFSALDSIARELEIAINLDNEPKKIPEEFLETFMSIDIVSLMRAKKLRLCLVESGNAEVAQLLTNVLRLRQGEGWVEPTSRDNNSIENAVLRYFPTKEKQPIVHTARSVGNKLGARILERMNQTLFLEGIPEMKKAEDGTLVPVCRDFAKDQRNTIPRINGRPVLLSNIPTESEQECEFVERMKELADITENQIMTASYICTQSVANTLSDIAIPDNLLPFTDEQKEKTGVHDMYRWGLPGNLTRDQNFIMSSDGNVIVKVRLSLEKLDNGLGYSQAGDAVMCTLDPENSFFLTELVMNIKRNGEISECEVTKFDTKREVIEVLA